MEGGEGMVKVPSSLLSQSISVITDDKVLRANLSLFSDLPSSIVKKIANNVSAYGLCLLESKGFLKAIEKERLWKTLASRIANKFYEPGSQGDTTGRNTQQIYFQRVFHDVVQHFDKNEDLFVRWFVCYLKKSRLFSKIHKESFTDTLKSLKTLLQDHLKIIRFYPRILQNLEYMITLHKELQSSTSKVNHIELRDFMSFKQCHISCVRNVLCTKFFPDLKGLTFLNCKFGALSMENFHELLLDDHTKNRTITSNELKRERKIEPEEPVEEDSFATPKKQQKFTESFDGVTYSINHSNRKTYPSCDLRNGTKSEIRYSNTDGKVAPCITSLSLRNCHAATEAMDILCDIVNKLPRLTSFALSPEWRLLIRESDEIIKAILLNPANNNCIESIILENCMPGCQSKRLLLWHKREQCSKQNTTAVPKPRTLKLIDCNLNSSQIPCHNSISFAEHGLSNSTEFRWCFDSELNCACNWSDLITLDLSENKFGSTDAEALAQALKFSLVLKSIKLADCGMDTSGCSFIFKMAKESISLEHLDMSGNSYDSCHDGNLMSLFIHGKLKSLILACCIGPGAFTEETMRWFSRNSTLEALCLSGNRIGEEEFGLFIKVLADPSALSSLKVLDLSCNKIPGSLLPSFANSLELSNRKMKEVKLTDNPVHYYLVQEKENSSLAFLDRIKKRVASFKIDSCKQYISHAGAVAFSDFASVM